MLNYDTGNDLIYCANQNDSLDEISKYFNTDSASLIKYNNITNGKVADAQAIVNPSVQSMDVFDKDNIFEIDNTKTRAY